MRKIPAQYATEYRLARHYLNKLRTAAVAVKRGRAAVSYGLALFEQEWEQIKHWHTWAAQYSADYIECAHLCKDFPLVGGEILRMRTSATDHAVWLEIALEAAQRLQDGDAVRNLCNELGLTYYRLGTLEKLKYFASQLLKLGEMANDSLAIGRGFYFSGAYAEERGIYVEAEPHYLRALQIFIELKADTETGRTFNALGSVALYIGDYQNAYRHYSQYLALMEAKGHQSGICAALLAVGNVLVSLKDYAEAEKYLRRGIDLCRILSFQRLLGAGLINLGLLAIEQNRLELAGFYFEEGIQAVRAVGTQRQIIRGLHGLGYLQLRLQNYKEALTHLREGLEMARVSGMPRHICDLQRTLADTFLALDDIDAARRALHESMTVARNLHSNPQKVRTLSSAVKFSQRLGAYEQAAIWAGRIISASEIDRRLFKPICIRLEADLGTQCYRQMLEHGKTLNLDTTVSEALNLLMDNPFKPVVIG